MLHSSLPRWSLNCSTRSISFLTFRRPRIWLRHKIRWLCAIILRPVNDILTSRNGGLLAYFTKDPTLTELHDRMPVILGPEDWPAWLGEAESDAALLKPAGDDGLKVWPIGRLVNSPRKIGAELLGEVAHVTLRTPP
jgi:SOS response associated peptidase (SRAP)